METTPGKRLQLWREYKGLTLAHTSRLSGVKVTTLSTSEQPGASNPSFDTLSKILTAFPDLNPDWLLTGSGPMLRDGKELTRLPADPAPAQPTAALAPVAEGAELKEVKRDRDKWRDMALGLMEELRQRPQRQLVATGTDGGSFPSGSEEPAEVIANRASMALAA